MKQKIKFYLGFILAFLFIALSFTIKAQSTTKSYTSTLPFGNTDNLQIYNAVRLSGGGGGTQSVVITNTNYATSNLQGQINQNITNVRTKLDTTNQYLRAIVNKGSLTEFNFTITLQPSTIYSGNATQIGTLSPVNYSINLGSGKYKISDISLKEYGNNSNQFSQSKGLYIFNDTILLSDNINFPNAAMNSERGNKFLNYYNLWNYNGGSGPIGVDYAIQYFHLFDNNTSANYGAFGVNDKTQLYNNMIYTDKLYFILTNNAEQYPNSSSQTTALIPLQISVKIQFIRID